MRKVKFRGKPVDLIDFDALPEWHQWTKHGWVYGYLIDKDIIVGKVVDFSEECFTPEFWCRVDPATVGQFTGFRDKNKMEICEGDIIRLVTADYEKITIVCKFGNVRRRIFENEVEITGFYYVRSNDGRKTFPITHNYLGKHDTEIWEVIGNIHDNPELMRS